MGAHHGSDVAGVHGGGLGAPVGKGAGHRLQRLGAVAVAEGCLLYTSWVFRGTIFENIAYGKENATMDEVVSAAKIGRAHV